MSSMVVRFPGGAREFRYPAKLPAKGDAIVHDGDVYRVVSVVENDRGAATVVVEPASPGLIETLQSEEGALRPEPIGVQH